MWYPYQHFVCKGRSGINCLQFSNPSVKRILNDGFLPFETISPQSREVDRVGGICQTRFFLRITHSPFILSHSSQRLSFPLKNCYYPSPFAAIFVFFLFSPFSPKGTCFTTPRCVKKALLPRNTVYMRCIATKYGRGRDGRTCWCPQYQRDDGWRPSRIPSRDKTPFSRGPRTCNSVTDLLYFCIQTSEQFSCSWVKKITESYRLHGPTDEIRTYRFQFNSHRWTEYLNQFLLQLRFSIPIYLPFTTWIYTSKLSTH